MRNADWTSTVSVLDRVTAIFDAFGEHGDGIGVSELARRANLPKSTVSRIVAELVSQRFLDREGSKLFLGVRLFELGQTVSRPRKLREAALSLLNDLRLATGRNVQLTVLDRTNVVFVAVLRGSHSDHPSERIGARRPAHATAPGKAMLAFASHAVVAEVLRDGLQPCTPHTICDPAHLLRELAETRKTRTATEREEYASDSASVASPVLGYGSVPLAAISIAGSAEELDIDRLAPAVRATAANVSRRLGTSR
ncbi:IclR family transcriptional regulator [Mycetocola zhujimingii]|uniref:IclR family transcriptional regulator n=1 Tax=Mycetocola zhujimingii TaxID=2079792 RepID=UPI000D34B31A|nr:IclR family transcriptional regulator [Mycetocola zhujimingii]AWB85388.1 IclR family transcriptional regulator [Mycetocola zhujimingii]